jgi:hypothetical protein
MAEAYRSTPYTAAVITTARQRAISAVKQDFRARGVKVTHLAQRGIIAAANDCPTSAPVREKWRLEERRISGSSEECEGACVNAASALSP